MPRSATTFDFDPPGGLLPPWKFDQDGPQANPQAHLQSYGSPGPYFTRGYGTRPYSPALPDFSSNMYLGGNSLLNTPAWDTPHESLRHHGARLDSLHVYYGNGMHAPQPHGLDAPFIPGMNNSYDRHSPVPGAVPSGYAGGDPFAGTVWPTSTKADYDGEEVTPAYLSPESPQTIGTPPTPQTLETPYTPDEQVILETPASSKTGTKSSRNPDPIMGLYFHDEEHAARKDRVFWRAPFPDKTVPKTYEEKKVIVKKVVDAILNNKGCKEKDTGKTFINRWSANSDYYDAEDIEETAWKLTTAMINVHTKGWTESICDRTLRKQISLTDRFSFHERLTKVTDLLKLSKRTCEDILKGEKLYSVIGAPHILQIRTLSNSKSNKRKAARIKFATDHEKEQALLRGDLPVEKKGKKRVRADPEDSTESSIAPVERPVKKARNVKARAPPGTHFVKGLKSPKASKT